jgi:hypothetical protein
MSSTSSFCGKCGKRNAGRRRCCPTARTQVALNHETSEPRSPPRTSHLHVFRVTRSGTGPLTSSAGLSSPTRRRRTTTRTPARQPLTQISQNTNTQPTVEHRTIFGVGPSPPETAAVPTPAPVPASAPAESQLPEFGSLLRSEPLKVNVRDDIWHWMRPITEQQYNEYKHQKIVPAGSTVVPLGQLPQTAYVGCIFCE